MDDQQKKIEDHISPSDEIMRLKQELERASRQAQEYLDGWKRAKADYLNLKKETEKQKKEWIEFANIGLLLELFPIVDQLKKAFQHLPKEFEASDWIQGIRHIQSNVLAILKNCGIEEIKTVGEVFNPAFHESVEEVESGQEKGRVVEEVSMGFEMNGRVIQPAKVKVEK